MPAPLGKRILSGRAEKIDYQDRHHPPSSPPDLLLIRSFEVISGRKTSADCPQGTSSGENRVLYSSRTVQQRISILDLLLTDQIHTAPLTLAEKAQFIKIAVKYITKEEIIEQFAERIELRETSIGNP